MSRNPQKAISDAIMGELVFRNAVRETFIKPKLWMWSMPTISPKKIRGKRQKVPYFAPPYITRKKYDGLWINIRAVR